MVVIYRWAFHHHWVETKDPTGRDPVLFIVTFSTESYM